MPTEYYERTRQRNSIRPITAESTKVTFGFGFGRLFFKQLTAAAVLTLLIYGAANSNVPFFNNCADALGRAIRYETDFQKLKDQIFEYLPNPFKAPQSSETPANTPAKNPSVPQ